MIVVGKVAEIRKADILGFGIYKKEVTQQNIKDNGMMQVVIATMEDSPKGFRLTGTAFIEEKLVLYKAEKVKLLL